jgi:AraC-like DNA-binding protein
MLSPEILLNSEPEILRCGTDAAELGRNKETGGVVLCDFDFWYVVRGRGAVKVDGRWREFAGGDLVCLLPGQCYQGDRSDAVEAYLVHYVYLRLQDGGRRRDERALAAHLPEVCRTWSAPQLHRAFTEAIETVAAGGGRLADLDRRAAALRLLSAVLHAVETPVAPGSENALAAVMRARRFIEEHFAKPLRVETVAAAADLSASHLTRLFREHLGTSPGEYMLDCRIKRAQALLARGVDVTRTAERTGFGSIHHFSRTFRRRMGASPSQFRAAFARYPLSGNTT